MIIIGHGLDVVNTGDFACLEEESIIAWESVTFASLELAEVDRLEPEQRLRRLTGKFAAKEAIYKSVGGDSSGEIDWYEIEVLTEPSGRPYTRSSGAWHVRCQALGVTQFAISISHAGLLTFASAIAIADTS